MVGREIPEIQVIQVAAGLVVLVVAVELFRVAIVENQIQVREGLAFQPEVTGTQVVREILQLRARLGIIFRVVPQEMAVMEEL
jgi:hypothetical protein